MSTIQHVRFLVNKTLRRAGNGVLDDPRTADAGGPWRPDRDMPPGTAKLQK